MIVSFYYKCSLNSELIKFVIYRKIPKISPGPYIFQRTFLRGLYSEGLIIGGKFAFQNRLIIIGGKFMSAIAHCANYDIGALTTRCNTISPSIA